MKTNKLALPLLGLTLVLSLGFIQKQNVTEQVNASFKDVVEINEDFNKKELNDNVWKSNDTSMNIDHYSLRMDPTDYLWTGHLIQQNANCNMKSSYQIDMDLTSYATVGNWFAISLGLKEKSGAFSDAPFALLFYPSYLVAGVNGNVCNWDQNGYLAPLKENIYATPFTKYGIYSHLRINVTLVNSFTSLVYFDVFDMNGNPIAEHDPVNDVYLVNNTLTGYIGFNNSGVEVEITNFKITNTDTKEVVYNDDFTTSSILYPKEGSGDWASMSFSTSEVFLGPVAELKLDSKDSYITSKKSFVSTGVNSIYTLYTQEMTVNYSSMTQNAIAGFEISKPSISENGYIFGVKKNNNGFGYSLVVCDKSNNIIDSVTSSIDAPNSTLILCLEVHNDKSVTLYDGNLSISYKVDKVNGYYGVKNISSDNQSCIGPHIDDYVMTKTIDLEEQAEDVAINFNGIKEQRIGPLLLNNFYISKKEWQFTNSKDFALTEYDDEYVGEEPQDGKALFNEANSTYFGSKNKYTNFVAKFDINVCSDVQYMNNYAGFIFEYGLEKFSTYYDNAHSVGLYNIQPGDLTKPTQTQLIGKHANLVGSTENAMNFPVPGSVDEFYQLFEKRGGEYPTFNFVIVVKDGIVSVSFKFSDEPESVLLTPRATFIAEKETTGYAAIVGVGGLTFTLDNYSITNLDYVETDNNYVSYKDTNYQINTRKNFTVDGSNLTGLEVNNASIANKALKIKDGGEVKTIGKIANGFFRYRIKSLEESVSFNIGNASITLIDDNTTKRVVVADNVNSQTIPLGNDFIFNNSLIEFEKVGGSFNIKLLSGDKPLSAISLTSYNFSLNVGDTYNQVIITSVGLSYISLMNVINYDSHQTIYARDYDPAKDDVIAWTVRPSLQSGNAIPTYGIVLLIVVPIVAAGIIILIIFLKKRKRKEGR